MILDALKYLVELGQSATKAEVIPLPDGKQIVNVNGVPTEYKVDRKTRSAKVTTLPSFVDWVLAIGEGRDVEVVVGLNNVVCKVDQELPVSDCCVLELTLSRPMAALKSWSSGPQGLRKVVQLLRSSLADTYAPSYLAVFRRLDFARQNATKLDIRHAGESLGRAVESAAQSSEGDIPETLAFEVPIYRLGVPMPLQKLRYAVDVDCSNETIAISEIGDCLTLAYEQSQADIAEWLTSRLGDSLVLLG